MSCAYRYSQASLTSVSGATFDTVMNTGYNYQWCLRNNKDYYTQTVTPNPPSNLAPYYLNYRYVRDGYCLAQYYQKLQAVQPNEAVILVHGSSTGPDFWFYRPPSDPWADTYLNGGGLDVFAAGYDCYAPYVTHAETDAAPFCRASGRLAVGYGEKFGDLDTKRVVAVFNEVKAKGYSKIHLVGISYGGGVVMDARKILDGDPQLGMSLIIEGWLPAKANVSTWQNLTASNVEVVFQMNITDSEFGDVPADTYLAYGSCNAANYAPWYTSFSSDQVITYTGAHEFLMSVFNQAMTRYTT